MQALTCEECNREWSETRPNAGASTSQATNQLKRCLLPALCAARVRRGDEPAAVGHAYRTRTRPSDRPRPCRTAPPRVRIVSPSPPSRGIWRFTQKRVRPSQQRTHVPVIQRWGRMLEDIVSTIVMPPRGRRGGEVAMALVGQSTLPCRKRRCSIAPTHQPLRGPLEDLGCRTTYRKTSPSLAARG